MTARAQSERGFSLIEVIVSLGLMAGVLLSVAGLFLLGERQVRRGREESMALAQATTILEEIGGWNYDATWERFGLVGDVATHTVDSRVNAFAAKWHTEIHDDLSGGHAEIRLESCDGSQLVDAAAVRVVVTVFWNEPVRMRRTQLAMVKM